MNKILVGAIPILSLLMISPAFAIQIFGGQPITYTFDKCTYLVVNITPSELHEWTAQGCDELVAGNFYCNCYDNFNLVLTPAVNSVGDFTITMTNYYYAPPQVTQIIISGGWVPPGGMCQVDGCEPGYTCVKNTSSIYWGKCLNVSKIAPTNNTYNVTPTQTINSTTTIPNQTTPNPTPTEEFDYTPYALGFIIFIIVIGGIYYYFKTRKPKVEEESLPQWRIRR